MSELAQELIKIRAQTRSWSLQSYPGKVKLPSDILRALPNAEAATKVRVFFSDVDHELMYGYFQILKTVYLPEETSAWLAESSKSQKPVGSSKVSLRAVHWFNTYERSHATGKAA